MPSKGRAWRLSGARFVELNFAHVPDQADVFHSMQTMGKECSLGQLTFKVGHDSLLHSGSALRSDAMYVQP